jgi:hypothetical protein
MELMTDLNIFIALGLLISIGLSGYGLLRIPLWDDEERGFRKGNFKWKKILAVSTVVSFIIGLTIFYLTQNPWAGISVIPLAYLMVLGTVTDMKVLMIPRDISALCYWIPVPLLLIFADSYGWLSFGIWMAVVALFFVFSYAGAFGFADLRIMILAGTSISWWIGAENILLAFGASAFVQLLIYPLAHKFNWGIVKIRKSVTQSVKDNEADSKLNSEEDIALNESAVPATEPARKKPKGFFGRLLEKINNFINGQSKKEKRFVPFGPALMISFCAVSLYYAKTFAVFIEPHYGWWNY